MTTTIEARTAMVANTATPRPDRPHRPYVRRHVWAVLVDGNVVRAYRTEAEARNEAAVLTTVLHIDNGTTVRIVDGTVGTVGSAHYHGPIDGTGTTTLCFIDGTEWSGPAATVATVLS
jgi:hypothetical protein